MQGKGLSFIPGAVDSASTHIGRVAQHIKKGRQMASGGSNWDIADFETIADDIDKKDDEVSASMCTGSIPHVGYGGDS